MERTKSLGTLDNMDIPNPIMKEEKRDMSVGTQTMELSPKDYLKTLLGLSVEDILSSLGIKNESGCPDDITLLLMNRNDVCNKRISK